MAKSIEIVALAFLLSTLVAQAQSQVSTVGTNPADASYVVGGIGIDEMEQLKARENEFNLKLVFTLLEGNYLSDVDVAVKDVTGMSRLAINAQGPVVLARLPRGSYVVEATYEGKKQTRKITLGERLRTEYMRWPSNPATDYPGPKTAER